MAKLPSFLKLTRKKVIIAAVIALAAFLIFNFFLKPKPAVLQFAEVKYQDIRSEVSSSGSLTGKDSVNLKFKSAGKLAYINVKSGTILRKGDVIAGLDTQDLSIKLQQAQNTLRDKYAIVDKILDDVKDHSKDESFIQRQTRTTAEVARDSAYDEVKAAQRAFQDAVIVAPFSGLITQSSVVAGQTVLTSDTIAQLVDNSEVLFDTDIDEADIGKVKPGQPAEITLDAYESQTFKGTVAQILPQTKTTSSGATVVTARIKLETPPAEFVNDLSGQSSIIVDEVKNALTIPQEALRDNSTVVISVNKKLEAVKVETGIASDSDIEIKTGLGVGDKVVLNPPAVGAKLN